MKKFILAGTVVAALAGAGVASAASVTVVDPSPGGTFTGSYTYTYSCPTTANPNQTCTGTATQNGYVQVNSGGVVACNGNPQTLNGPEGSGQGEIWVGPSNAPSGGMIVGAAPGNAAGAGNNGTSATQGPCNQNPSSTGVTP